MVDSISIEVQFFDRLDESLKRLEGGDLSIGEFSKEVMSPECEALIAENSSSLHLLWDILNHLYQYLDFSDAIPEGEVIEDIRQELDQWSQTHLSSSKTSETRIVA